jgi:hypothetical protein
LKLKKSRRAPETMDYKRIVEKYGHNKLDSLFGKNYENKYLTP